MVRVERNAPLEVVLEEERGEVKASEVSQGSDVGVGVEACVGAYVGANVGAHGGAEACADETLFLTGTQTVKQTSSADSTNTGAAVRNPECTTGCIVDSDDSCVTFFSPPTAHMRVMDGLSRCQLHPWLRASILKGAILL